MDSFLKGTDRKKCWEDGPGREVPRYFSADALTGAIQQVAAQEQRWALPGY